MATYTFVSGNWGSSSSWSPTGVPGSGDDVIFNGTSGNCTVNVTSACASINCNGYSANLQFDADLTVGGDIELGGSLLPGTGKFKSVIPSGGTANLKSNGVTVGVPFEFLNPTGAGITTGNYFLQDNWIFTDLKFALTGGNTIKLYQNGGSETLTITGNLAVSSGTSGGVVEGDVPFTMTGSGTWSGSSACPLKNDFTINGPITVSGTVSYHSGTLKYTPAAGSVTTTGSTLRVGATTTLDTVGITWNNVTFTGNIVIILSSDMAIAGTFLISSGMTINGAAINMTSLTYATANTTAGTTNFVFYQGGGTWQHTGSGSFKNNLEINLSSGTLTISGTVKYGSGQFKYTTGSVTGTASAVLQFGVISSDTTTVTLNAVFAPTNIIIQLKHASLSNATIFFNGTSGFDIPSLVIAASGSNNTITFTQTRRYEVNA